MSCYRCGVRQSDPVRGASRWKRGVRGGAQVLICPECQHDRDWAADLDACPRCSSTTLHRALGETTCRTCGSTTGDGPSAGGGVAELSPGGGRGALADDVAAALARVLHGGVH